LQADYVTVVKDGPIMSAKYRLPVILGQNWPTQQSHGLFATAKILVIFHDVNTYRWHSTWSASPETETCTSLSEARRAETRRI